MADQEQLALLEKGAGAWNNWRVDNPRTQIDLIGADLHRADLRKANLSGANLSGANLWAIQASETNFEGTILTGACIQDWHTNSETNLNNVICDYIYLKYDDDKCYFVERLPQDSGTIFNTGEFTRLFQKGLDRTIDNNIEVTEQLENKSIAEEYKNTIDLFETVQVNQQSIQQQVTRAISESISPLLQELSEFKSEVLSQIDQLQESLNSLQSITPKPNPNTPIDKIPLKTAYNDYTQLQYLLAAGQWQEADEETDKRLRFLYHFNDEHYCKYKDLLGIPCYELHIINALWVHYSNRHFGFSVQQEIFLEMGCEVDYIYYYHILNFAYRLGWLEEKSDRTWDTTLEWTSAIQYSLNAPRGHLPRLSRIMFKNNDFMYITIGAFFQRLSKCNIMGISFSNVNPGIILNLNAIGQFA